MGRRGFLRRLVAGLTGWLAGPWRRLLAGEGPTGREPGEIVVVGGGYAGMAAAALLEREGYLPIVLEREDTVGGRSRGGTYRGWHYPRGTEYIGRPEGTVAWLFERAGLEPVAVPPPEGAYWVEGKLLRDGPALARWLGAGAPEQLERLERTLRPLAKAVWTDPWDPGRKALEADRVSLAQLLERLGVGARIAALLDGQMRGIFGARSDEISALYAAPEAWFEVPDLEAEAGERPGPDEAIYTLAETLGALPARLAERMGERVWTGAEAQALSWDDERRRFRLRVRRGGTTRILSPQAVVLAVPAPVALEIAGASLRPETRGALAAVRYASYVTVHLMSERPLLRWAWDVSCLGTVFTDLYDSTRIEAARRGVSDRERPGILSAYLPEPNARSRRWLEADDRTLRRAVERDLARVLGRPVHRAIREVHIERFSHAFPVIAPGYHERVLAPIARGERIPLALAGDYACYPTIEGAVGSAEAALERLED